MGTPKKLLITILAAIMMIVALSPMASATDNDQSEPTGSSEGCTEEQVEGGYETNPDGSCGLSGWNWNFAGACPASFDASVGDWGSVNCSIVVCESCSHNPVPDGPSPDPGAGCVSPDETWTDEEGGQFYPEHTQRFVNCCIAFGGEVISIDFGNDEYLQGCHIGGDRYYCTDYEDSALSCWLQDEKPAPSRTVDHDGALVDLSPPKLSFGLTR